ncbi:hypothetical protein ACFQJ7_10710 [Halovenus rubra]|uniref:Uncharacterized protein n=2 Tax=Halovenus rubra TaxID=869890 RepID=A0ACC7DX20_9EURY|nr:hypothetical protein [Halovenus rubra]
MFRTVRDGAPSVLVPAAWFVAASAQHGPVGTTAMFIAHLVMVGFIAMFTVTGWSAMETGALRGWRLVLVGGFGVTVAGIGGFLLESEPLLAISLVGWMVLPAAGLIDTGRRFTEAQSIYYASGTLSVVGTFVYLAAATGPIGVLSLGGFVLVATGQTAGIVHATTLGV